jgi:hypothetical protein
MSQVELFIRFVVRILCLEAKVRERKFISMLGNHIVRKFALISSYNVKITTLVAEIRSSLGTLCVYENYENDERFYYED